jgi:very-short-patch-repair endonuclease
VTTPEPQFPPRPFTWSEAKQLGIGRHRLDAAVRNGRLRRVLTGVYVPADIPDTNDVRAAAAALVLGRHAVACDRTAAWLQRIDVLEYRELDVLPPIETYVLRGHTPTRRPQCAGGSRDLRPEDIELMGDVAVTIPVRTAMDLGCKLSRRDALAALDAFMRLHGVTQTDMVRMLPRYFRRRGVVQLRQLIPLADPRAESSGESWTRMEIRDAGLPSPVLQHWVVVDGRATFRLDLAYPHARVAVEYDGREFHEGDERREADRLRRAWLRDHGWTVIVVDKDSFTPEALSAWLGELRAALRIAQ